MSDLFTGNSLVEVELWYTVEKNKYGVPNITVVEDDEAAKLKADPLTKETVRVIRTKWRPQSWKSSNDLLSQSMTYNAVKQEADIDWTRFRDGRLKASLLEWSGDDVKDVPCTAENINKLHASVAVALLEKYDKAMSGDKKEITKNS